MNYFEANNTQACTITLTITKQRSCRLWINDERLTMNEKRKFLGNYMVIRVKQKGKNKTNPPTSGEVGRLCAYNRELFFV